MLTTARNQSNTAPQHSRTAPLRGALEEMMKELAALILIVVIVIGLIFGIPLGLAVASEKGYCRDYPKIDHQYDYRWEFWSGCMVNVPGYGWVHAVDYFNLNRLGLDEQPR